MNVTDVIALLAFIVALYGAILSTYTALNEFFRINLSYLNESFITLSETPNFLNDHGEHIDIYDNDLFTIAIFVRITNKSKNPTTINSFVLNDKYYFDSSFNNYYAQIPVSFEHYQSKLISRSVRALPISLKPLLKLDSLSSLEGYLIFNDLKEVPSNFKITINAVQKSKDFDFNFNLTNDYRNEIH